MTTNGHTSRSGVWGISGLLLLAALVAGLAPTSAYAAGYQMPITFSGYTNAPSKTESLTNFPVLVVFSNGVGGSFFNFATFPFATTNGYDLRFYTNATDTGSGLNYEIDSWNTNSACYVWVQAPLISTNGATAITARWGDTNYKDQLPCTTNGATWTNGYIGVWHLSDGTTLTARDSSPMQHNATAIASPTVTTGRVDGAANFSTSFNDYFNFGNVSDYNFERTNPFSVEAWVYGLNTSGGCIVGKGISASPYTGWYVTVLHRPEITGTAFELDFNSTVAGGGNYINVSTTNNSYAASNWYHVVATYSGSGAA